VRNDRTMQHFWRDESTFAWHPGVVFGRGVSTPPVMIQGQYGMSNELGANGNFELCVAVGGRVQHWWRWNAGGDRDSSGSGDGFAHRDGRADSGSLHGRHPTGIARRLRLRHAG